MPKPDHPAAQRRQREAKPKPSFSNYDLRIRSQHVASWLRTHLEDLEGRVCDRRCRLLVGKYKGREAIVKAIIPDDGLDGLLFLCVVQRADGRGALNADGESRQYRPAREFELL